MLHKVDEVFLKKFIELFEKFNGNITATCKALDVKGVHASVKNWREKYPWFNEQITQIMDDKLQALESQAWEMAGREVKPDPGMIRFILTQHPRARQLFGYARTNKVEQSGNLSWADILEKGLSGKEIDKAKIIMIPTNNDEDDEISLN